MADFVRVTEISIVRSHSGLVDYWTETPSVIDVSKVMKANRKRQSRIHGGDLKFTVIMFENGIEVPVLESLDDLFSNADKATSEENRE